MTALMIGAGLALAIGVFGTLVGFDRDRSFYPTILVVIACLYSLFAMLDSSHDALVPELVAGAAFVAAAVFGFRSSLWLVAAALVGHGIFDFFHPRLIANPGVPTWWPAFCGAYDVVAGVYLGVLVSRNRIRAPS